MSGWAAFAAGVACGVGAAVWFAEVRRLRRSRQWQRDLLARKADTYQGSGVKVLPSEPVLTVDGAAAFLGHLDRVERAACPGCHGEGYVDGDYSQVVCLTCHGSGDAA